MNLPPIVSGSEECINNPGGGASWTAQLVIPSGDGIGDACDDFSTIGATTPYELLDIARLRGSAWAGRGDKDGDPGTTVAFFYRGAPQLADNDRDGVGNYCETGWNYGDETGTGVFDDGFQTTDQPNPGMHGVPGGLLPDPAPAWVAQCGCGCASVESESPAPLQMLPYLLIVAIPGAIRVRMRAGRRRA